MNQAATNRTMRPFDKTAETCFYLQKVSRLHFPLSHQQTVLNVLFKLNYHHFPQYTFFSVLFQTFFVVAVSER